MAQEKPGNQVALNVLSVGEKYVVKFLVFFKVSQKPGNLVVVATQPFQGFSFFLEQLSSSF